MTYSKAFVAAFVLASGFSGVGWAQTDKNSDVWKSEPAQRWVGVWARKGSPVALDDSQIANVPPTVAANAPPSAPPPLKGKYLQRYLAEEAAEKRGDASYDESANCLPPGLPFMMNMAYPMEILWSPGQVTIIAEYMSQTRRIYTDGRRPSTDTDPSYVGFSVGRWEGDTLVVETTALSADSPGFPHSAALTVSEKFIPQGPNVLRHEMTLRDPNAFTQPITEIREFDRAPGMTIMESICEENNRDQVQLSDPKRAAPAAPRK